MVSTFLGLLDDRYRDRLDERAHGFIRRAIDGSTRMQGMIREILDFSRVGRGERAEESFHMADIVQVAITNLQAAIEQSGAQIQLGELPKVRANRLQCVQLMQNLIGNALKYHSDKTPIVRISSVAENSRWRISVTDNGIGIDPVHHQRIFQVFQRLHGREQFEGNGIGLSLCQKIVLAHGGTIGVESQLGQGATFWFTLPDALANTDPTPTSGMYPLLDVDADAEK
jgi:light-regulated signal transduction histidine kinase (bacteriophytochrome)